MDLLVSPAMVRTPRTSSTNNMGPESTETLETIATLLPMTIIGLQARGPVDIWSQESRR